MSIAATIVALRRAGVPDSQILDAVIEMDEARRAAGRARVAKCRENKKVCNVTHVTDVTSVTDPSLAKEKSPPAPPSKENSTLPPSLPSEVRATKGARGARLPADWQPSADEVNDAIRIGLSFEETTREADRFRDHFLAQPGQRGVKTNWSATFRNWCRKAVEIKRSRPPPRQSQSGSWIETAARITGRYPDEHGSDQAEFFAPVDAVTGPRHAGAAAHERLGGASGEPATLDLLPVGSDRRRA